MATLAEALARNAELERDYAKLRKRWEAMRQLLILIADDMPSPEQDKRAVLTLVKGA